MKVVPCTLPVANGYVSLWHRHHAPLPGGFGWFCVATADNDGTVHGVAIAGRPTNRNNDDGLTVEVQRVATDGARNACSILLGACARAAKAVGARRCITYTLDSEAGSSLRGAGWIAEADGIQSWWTHPGADGGGRTAAVDRPHMAERKVRWAIHFDGAASVRATAPPVSDERPAAPSLFPEEATA